MSTKKPSKRHILIDGILLTTIFSVFLSVIFYTFFLQDETLRSAEVTKVYEPAQGTISEHTSTHENISIVTDTSNDAYLPYAIQYPLTTYSFINEKISSYIQTEKENYLSLMQEQLAIDNNLLGELNISFKLYTYDSRYTSLLLKTYRYIPNSTSTETYTTFVFNKENGKLYTFSDLLNNNEESLHTLAKQTESYFEKNIADLHVSITDIQNATKPLWENFESFILDEGELHLFFNQLSHPSLKTPIQFTVSLSTINPLLTEELQLKMVEPVNAIVQNATVEKKWVALTFDDGPHPEVTPQILAKLKAYDAKATFFMLGSRVEYYPEIVQQALADGHEIGNHTWNHPVLTTMNATQVLKEFTDTEEAIFAAIGQGSTIFRPPYGATNRRVQEIIMHPSINWTIDTEDWKHRSAQALLPSVKRAIHPNAIILMHDIHQSTADGLEDVLAYLTSEGYEFVTVSSLLHAE